jgi:hypothetical protein
MNNKNRQGRFTSSQMFRLLGTPAVKKTYIKDINIERKMQRCLDVGSYSQSMAWGRYMETRVFQLMDKSYTMVSKETIVHPEKELEMFWSGSPDLIAFNKKGDAEKVSEVKCFYPKAFSELTDAILSKDIEQLKACHKGKEYWQVVSNAILCGVDTAEIISYMPKKSEMIEIRDDVSNFEGEDLWQYRFIVERSDAELPVLNDHGFYDSLNVFTFEVPMEDKVKLTEAVINASSELEIW